MTFTNEFSLPEAAIFKRAQNEVVRIVVFLVIVILVVTARIVGEFDGQASSQLD